MGAGPTLRAVARAAGVSASTVSNAYNRPGQMSAAVRARVLAAATELGYPGPDPVARSLRSGRVGAVGVLFGVPLSYAFTDPYCSALLSGLAEVSEQTRTSLVMIPVAPPSATGLQDEEEVRRSVQAVRQAVVDGVVADGVHEEHPALRVLLERGLPVVRSVESVTSRSVHVDDRAGGRALGEHLAGLGHREVAVVVDHARTGDQGPGAVVEASLYPYARLRLAGLREGLGPRARVEVLTAGSNTTEGGRAAVADLLDRRHGPHRQGPVTAVAAISDVLALGVLQAAAQRGLVAGRDLSVTGFDDAPAAAGAGLTTVHQPVHDKGRLMGRMLLDPTFTETTVRLPTELVVRSSTAPAPSTTTDPDH